MRQTCVADVVLFFTTGRRDESGVPAIITKTNGGMTVDISVIFPAAGSLRPLRAVRHVGDPWHQEHPRESQKLGGWDWLEQEEPKSRRKKGELVET